MFVRAWQRGFTLTELLLAIAVVSILLSAGAPSFQSMIAKSRLSSITSKLHVALITARSEAIKSNRRVTVCASEDLLSCNNASWSTGNIAFVDREIMGALDNDDQIVKGSQHSSPSLRVLQAGINGVISFTPDGASFTSAALIVCDLTKKAQPKRICVSRSGTVQVRTDACVEHQIACPT